MITNTFKRALAAGHSQIGLWNTLADPNMAEALATTGFDWMLIDAEHSPNDLRSISAQLQGIGSAAADAQAGAIRTQAVVRPPQGDEVLIKQYLELGVQSLLIPMVDTPEQAERLVAATRYPPKGIRGVGSAGARSSRWSSVPNYLRDADGEICMLVQCETTTSLDNLAAIAAVEGVDGVFFGPSDLSASMGLLGQGNHPEVVKAISQGISEVRAAGKAAGMLAVDPKAAKHYLDQGALFVAVGVDAMLLMNTARALSASFR